MFLGSIAGWFSSSMATGWGCYCAGKMALIAITKALRTEVKPFGITVTMCEPGFFRTPILSSASGRGIVYGELKGTIDDYNESMGKFYSMIEMANGNQPGSPEKGGERIVQALKGEGALEGWNKGPDAIPERWGLGDDSYQPVEAFLKEEGENLMKWKGLTQGVNID